MISLGILLVANRPNSADSGAMQPVQLNRADKVDQAMIKMDKHFGHRNLFKEMWWKQFFSNSKNVVLPLESYNRYTLSQRPNPTQSRYFPS